MEQYQIPGKNLRKNKANKKNQSCPSPLLRPPPPPPPGALRPHGLLGRYRCTAGDGAVHCCWQSGAHASALEADVGLVILIFKWYTHRHSFPGIWSKHGLAGCVDTKPGT